MMRFLVVLALASLVAAQQQQDKPAAPKPAPAPEAKPPDEPTPAAPSPKGERWPFRVIYDILPEETTAEAMVRDRLVRPGLLRRALPHLPATWHAIGEDTLPEPVAAMFGKQLDRSNPEHKRIDVAAAHLFDGRKAFTMAWGDAVMAERSLVVFDAASNHAAGNLLPQVTVMSPWHKPPVLLQTDLDGTGAVTLVIDVHHHNGTVEDWDARHYLQVKADRLVAVLTHAHNLQFIHPPHEEGYLHQFVVSDGPTSLRLVTLYENAYYGPALVPIGEARLVRKALGEPFRTTERTAWLPGAECHLAPVTSDFARR